MAEFGNEIISMEGISKLFPGVTALEGIDLKLHEGEIHAIVGENGAGKSTLIKILTGVFQPTTGSIFIYGKKVIIRNPIVARNFGIGAVYQDVTAAKDLTVAENFFLGRIPRNRIGFADWKLMRGKAKEILSELNIQVDPGMLLKNLSAAQQEMVLIAKKYFDRSKVIIFDEPTALLTNDEIAELFKIIRRMRQEGMGIIYISHRLEEIFELCDTVTVIRDGEKTACLPVLETNTADLITKMVGRTIDEKYLIGNHEPEEEVLRTENLTSRGVFEDINIQVRRKEILGLFGLVGSGTTEIVRAIFGADRIDKGTIYVDSKALDVASPSMAIRRGIGFLPEDRKESGLAMKMSINHNINLSSYKDISMWGFIRRRQEKENSLRQIEALQIKTPGLNQAVANLSGGNQQKVVLGKWLTKKSKVFIFDEPTVGIDVGAKAEIYRILEKLIDEGSAIIVISSYLPEIMSLADRITVIHEGKQMGTLRQGEYTEEKLLRLASGLA